VGRKTKKSSESDKFMRYLLNFSVFEQDKSQEKQTLNTTLDSSPGNAFKKQLEGGLDFYFGSAGDFSIKKAITDAPEGKYSIELWKKFEKNLEKFTEKFPCLPKKNWSGNLLNKKTKNYLYYAIFLILKNSVEIKKTLQISTDQDFNQLLRLSLVILNQETWFSERRIPNDEKNMGFVASDSPLRNTIASSFQDIFLKKQASVGYIQMQLKTWNKLNGTHSLFETENIQSLGTIGNPNPAHFAVSMVAAMEYLWITYKKAKEITSGKTVITTDGKECTYSLGSWAWDVAYSSYTFPFEKYKKKYCKCQFVDDVKKEGPFLDEGLPPEQEIETSKGKTSIYWARNCEEIEPNTIFTNPGLFKTIGSNDVKRLKVIPKSHVPNYFPRFYQNLSRKLTNRYYLKIAYNNCKSWGCLGIK
jgi:hypothetical protein